MLLIGEMIFAMKSFLTNARLFKHDCWVIVAHPGMLGAQFGIGKNKELSLSLRQVVARSLSWIHYVQLALRKKDRNKWSKNGFHHNQ